MVRVRGKNGPKWKGINMWKKIWKISCWRRVILSRAGIEAFSQPLSLLFKRLLISWEENNHVDVFPSIVFIYIFFNIYLEFIRINVCMWHEVTMNFFSWIVKPKIKKKSFFPFSNFNDSFTIFWCFLTVLWRVLEFLRLTSGRELWLFPSFGYFFY